MVRPRGLYGFEAMMCNTEATVEDGQKAHEAGILHQDSRMDVAVTPSAEILEEEWALRTVRAGDGVPDFNHGCKKGWQGPGGWLRPR